VCRQASQLVDPADHARFDKERREADLKFLRENNLLSPEEFVGLEEKNRKRFGPEEEK
jgi:hypothetical protein